MAKTSYTYFQLCFLKECYKYFRLPELTREFNRYFKMNLSEKAIKSTLTNHGFTCGRGPGMTAKERLLAGKALLNLEQHYFVEYVYKDFQLKEIPALLKEFYGIKVTVTQLKNHTSRYGLKSGRTGHFPSGIRPWNEGTKGVIKPNSGNFKKGQIPATVKPMYSERDVKGEIYIKVPRKNPYTGAPTRYIPKAHWEWEQANGKPVPKGMVVRFKDCNNRNFAPDNLVCISKRLNLMLNRRGYKDVPAKMRDVAFTSARLEVAMFKQLKKRARHE